MQLANGRQMLPENIREPSASHAGLDQSGHIRGFAVRRLIESGLQTFSALQRATDLPKSSANATRP